MDNYKLRGFGDGEAAGPVASHIVNKNFLDMYILDKFIGFNTQPWAKY